ncbi:hypothetical protein P7K49_001275 [Saguinus oedipus]|uniref:Uncharacterized protein n=1 Tax=Saguinus oedipus TaxID=9490 RepID=A0ABQ9WFW1_SAGOE|nr:hypothetical protein P7K49_001275 [Saguinus oedipus]
MLWQTPVHLQLGSAQAYSGRVNKLCFFLCVYNLIILFSPPSGPEGPMFEASTPLVFKGMSISRPNAVVGRCRMIRHSRDKKNEPNPQRFDRIAHTKETMLSDGLNSLTYQVLDVQRYPLYTQITVDIGTPS